MNKKAIALIDGNNFYASCEQSVDPSIISKPIVVLSNNDGCIISRNAEARRLGIQMGQPYFKVRERLKRLGVIVRSSNYELYGDMSRRLMQTLKEHCEKLEIYSIDEAFVTITRQYNYNLLDWARQLRELAYQSLGLPIAIGIGTTKSQAKAANRLAKILTTYAGIFDLNTTNNESKWLEEIQIQEVWGIGPAMAKWCKLRGICNARQLRDMPSNLLDKKWGLKGIKIQNELKGQKCFEVEETHPPKQSIVFSRSYKEPIPDLTTFRQIISDQIVHLSYKLRKNKQKAMAISVFTRTSIFSNSFYSKTETYKLNISTNDTIILLNNALILASKIFNSQYPLTKVGARIDRLENNNYTQKTINNNDESIKMERRENLIGTIDYLNQRYGRDTITWGTCTLKQKFSIRLQVSKKKR